MKALSRSATDTLRDTLILNLPIPRDSRLEEHWLFFQVWGSLRPPGTTEWVRGFQSLHSRPDLFR